MHPVGTLIACDQLADQRAIAIVRTSVAEFFFESFAHAVDIAVLAEDERKHEPVVARSHLAVGAMVAHEGAESDREASGSGEGDGMALRSVFAGAMTDVAGGEQAAARDGLGSFADDHAVHDDEVAGLQVDERELVLSRDVLCDGTRRGSRCATAVSGGEGREGYEDVIAGIDLERRFRAWERILK